MRITLLFSALLAVLIVSTSARPHKKCKLIRKKGCKTKWQHTGAVCGTNGVTYSNRCQLEETACLNKITNLKVAKYEPCKTEPQLARLKPQSQQAGGDGEESSDSSGSSGSSRSSSGSSEEEEESDETGGDGGGGTMTPTTQLLTTAIDDPCNSTDICDPGIEEPLCAQRGPDFISFFNMCFFDIARCLDPSIIFFRDGSCDEATTNPPGTTRPPGPRR